MKKLLLTLVFAMLFAAAFNCRADGVVDKVCLYLPNRILDALDVFTVNIGFGPVARAELRATRAVQGGAGIGCTAKLFKDYNRQYGAGLQNGWDTAFICMASEDQERKNTTRLVQEYWEHQRGFPNPDERIYNIYNGARDYWELGGTLGGIVEADLALHPIDIADFVTGFLFIDLKGDDLTFDDFQ